MLLTILGLACHKELSRPENKDDEPRLSVAIENIDEVENDDDRLNDDNSNDEGGHSNDANEEISNSEINEHAIYTFMGVSGVYFGCTSSFRSKNESFEFIFGTNKTTNLKFTREEFEQLIHTGEREFGSLGAFTSFPQRYADKVEIAYMDKDGKRWCSTRLTENNTSEGIETSVKIEQSHSRFSIESMHKVEIAAETEGYRLKGTFECMLYEVNGKAKKKIKGDFIGIVAPQ